VVTASLSPQPSSGRYRRCVASCSRRARWPVRPPATSMMQLRQAFRPPVSPAQPRQESSALGRIASGSLPRQAQRILCLNGFEVASRPGASMPSCVRTAPPLRFSRFSRLKLTFVRTFKRSFCEQEMRHSPAERAWTFHSQRSLTCRLVKLKSSHCSHKDFRIVRLLHASSSVKRPLRFTCIESSRRRVPGHVPKQRLRPRATFRTVAARADATRQPETLVTYSECTGLG
jgi:hypothetical protein